MSEEIKKQTELQDANGQPIRPPVAPTKLDQVVDAAGFKYPWFKQVMGLLPRRLWGWVLGFVVLVGLPAYGTWRYWPSVSQWSWVEAITQDKLPAAQRFSIAIAKIEGDHDDAMRTLLMESLRDLLGLDLLRFDRATNLASASNANQAEKDAQTQAKQWLKDSGAHILIWGQVLPATVKTERGLRLHFSARDDDAQQSTRVAESQAISFNTVAKAEIEATVRLQVIAQLNQFDTSSYAGAELTKAIAHLQPLIESWPAGKTKADMQQTLANALYVQGSQTGLPQPLEQAITLYRQILLTHTRESAAAKWAMTQNNLGIALISLGERERGSKRLEQAAQAFESALQVYTRENAAADWAMTQNNLGIALRALGARESGSKRLEQAVKAYESALQVYTRESAAADWAMTQNNLGTALWALGERERGSKRLEQAVQAYGSALRVYTRESAAAQWAATQNNLGIALRALGERERGSKRLEQATQAFEAALTVYEAGKASRYVEVVQRNLQRVQAIIAERRAKGSQL